MMTQKDFDNADVALNSVMDTLQNVNNKNLDILKDCIYTLSTSFVSCDDNSHSCMDQCVVTADWVKEHHCQVLSMTYEDRIAYAHQLINLIGETVPETTNLSKTESEACIYIVGIAVQLTRR